MLTESFDNKYTNALVYRILKNILKVNNAIDFVDLDKSLAYSPEHNTMFGCLNLTQKGKEQEGFKQQLISELKKLPEVYDYQVSCSL